MQMVSYRLGHKFERKTHKSIEIVQYWSRVIVHFTCAYDIASASKSLASKSPMIYARSVWPYAQASAYDLRASTID